MYPGDHVDDHYDEGSGGGYTDEEYLDDEDDCDACIDGMERENGFCLQDAI